MAYLKQRVDGKALVQFGAQAGKGLVGEEDIPLHLSRNAINVARIAQSQRRPSVLEGSVCVEDAVEEGIGAHGLEMGNGSDLDLCGQRRLFQRRCRRHGRCIVGCIFCGDGLSPATTMAQMRWRTGGDGRVEWESCCNECEARGP